jgi:omega-hydroxy-beta-dihydromenaquinone-9 sulfotransferase
MTSCFPAQTVGRWRPAVAAEIKRKYYQLLRVATLHAGGKRLVLKNPVNTGRVRLLLEMFPNAKFIHAYRCPYDVFASMLNLYLEMLVITSLQTIPMDNAADAILTVYEAMMQRFFLEQSLIPQGNLVEVRFEDLERDPLGELARIYETLDLSGYDMAEPAFRAYVDSLGTYRKNRLRLTPEDRARIEQRWAFAFDRLGYRRQTDSAQEPGRLGDDWSQPSAPELVDQRTGREESYSKTSDVKREAPVAVHT